MTNIVSIAKTSKEEKIKDLLEDYIKNLPEELENLKVSSCLMVLETDQGILLAVPKTTEIVKMIGITETVKTLLIEQYMS